MPWVIFLAAWGAVWGWFYHMNPDLPAAVWIIIFGLGGSLSAICLSMAREPLARPPDQRYKAAADTAAKEDNTLDLQGPETISDAFAKLREK